MRSLAQQELLPHELVAVDDGSTDATVRQLHQFAKVAPFPVRIYQNESRLGYGMNFLRAANLCCGDAIAFCDQDDVWLPAKLSRVSDAMANQQADFVAHAADVTNVDLTKTGQRYPEINMDGCWDARQVREAFYPGFAIAVSRRFFANIRSLLAQPGFDIEAHDELICELAATGWKRCELSESLVHYRQHAANHIGYHGGMLKKKVCMSYKVTSTVFPEVFIFEPAQQQGEDGVVNFDLRAFHAATKTDFQFVQDNHSRSSHGVLRGLHYQIQHPQGKLVQVIVGAVFDVTVDLRKSSPNFGKWLGIELSSANCRQLWIPPSFAHGFLVLSESADLLYKATDYYAPVHERCLAWNDPALGIDWPFSSGVILSSKDAAGKLLANAECFD